MHETRLQHRDDRVTIVTRDNLLITIWCEAPTVESLIIVRNIAKTLLPNYPKGIALLHVANPNGPQHLSPEARKQAQKNARENSGQTLATAQVVPIHGFAGVIARAFMSALNLASRSDVPARVFGSVETAASWLAEHLNAGDVSTWEPQAIVQAFTHAQAIENG